MAIANLTVTRPTIPQPDHSWLSGLADNIGGIIDQTGDTRLARQALGGGASPKPQQSKGGFLSSLAGPQEQASPTVARSAIDPAIKDGIVKTANSLGISPADLATAISYETAGTFDPTKSGPTTQWGQHRGLIQFGEPQAQKYGVNWDDPVGSQLGENGAVANYLRDTGVKPGMGLMDIYSAINAGGVGRYDRSDANNGGAPGTVADKVNNQMAGHIARARALFGDAAAPATAADAVTAMGDGGSLASAFSGSGQAPRAPMQVADASGGAELLAQAATPVQRGSVDPEVLARMIGNPRLREFGIALWKQNSGQAGSEPWQFATLPDGSLVRQNQQTGAVERLGNFAKPNEDAIVVGDNLVRRSTGEVVYEGQPKTPASYQEYKLAQQDGFTGSYSDWEKVKVPGTSVTVNNGEGDKFYENLDKKNAETFSAMSQGGMEARAKMGQIDRLEGLLAQSPQGAEGATKQWLGDLGINTEGLDALQSTRALLETMVPAQRPPGSGPMSDADIVMFRNSLPRVVNQPGGNELILQTMRGVAQYEMQMGEIADMVADRVITPSEGRKRVRELENPLSAYKDAAKGFMGPASKTQSGVGAAPEGVDPNVWRFMTPEERKLWQN
ncbi:hypothetical protein ACQZ46_02635 [Agrobacterium salinitolerans]